MMRELKLEEMTLEQKIGQLICVRWFREEEDMKDIFKALARGEVGAMQIRWQDESTTRNLIRDIRNAAGYPVLICADMESGFPGSKLKMPYQMAIGSANDEKLAYELARITAIEAKNVGFSVVWGPIVDMAAEGQINKINRCFSDRVEDIVKYGCAMIRGYQDEGMICTAKHFLSGYDEWMDSHMCATGSWLDEEEVMKTVAQPYFAAMKDANLSGIMTNHTIFHKIDANRPGTLSSRILNIIRDQGFDGIIMSDSLAMMSIEEKFGKRESLGLAIAAGVDMVLPTFSLTYREVHDALMEAYRKGVFTEERLNEAVRRVLEAQEKTKKPASATELTEEQKKLVEELNRKSLCAVIKDGVELKLNPDTKKLFVLLYEENYTGAPSKELQTGNWFFKEMAEEKQKMIQAEFPDAEIMLLHEFPNQGEVTRICHARAEADEVIFFTFCRRSSYLASDSITERIKNLLVSSMDKIAAVVHMGNPYEIKKFIDAPRIFVGVTGSDCEKYAVKALKGEFVPTGKLPVEL